jgi:hypothetical protein
MDKSRVPKEAQDDALSDGMSGGRQTPPGRPTKDDAASMAIIFGPPSSRQFGEEDFEFFFKVSHQRESGNIPPELSMRSKVTMFLPMGREGATKIYLPMNKRHRTLTTSLVL